MKKQPFIVCLIAYTIIIVVLCLWISHLKVKTKINYKREFIVVEDNKASMSDNALRAYGLQMKSRCPDDYNEWVRRLVKDGYMVKTEGFNGK